jgi:archaemetzincin
MITLILPEEMNRAIPEFLVGPIENVFNQNIDIRNTFKLPDNSWNVKRNQYEADLILDLVPMPLPRDRNLAILDLDIFALGLNFVFGEADANTRKALISLKRLKPEYYGLPPDEDIFKERVLKEAIHELGHTYGLRHCPNRRCVMHFSNSIDDTDIKENKFCLLCRRRLNTTLQLLRGYL